MEPEEAATMPLSFGIQSDLETQFFDELLPNINILTKLLL